MSRGDVSEKLPPICSQEREQAAFLCYDVNVHRNVLSTRNISCYAINGKVLNKPTLLSQYFIFSAISNKSTVNK